MQRRLNKEEIEKLCEMYETGKYTFLDLSSYFPVTKDAIRGLLLRRGYKAKSHSELNRKYSLNEEFFDEIDTEEKAYMLGFIYADGCNYPESTRILLGLAEKDKEILDKFSILLESSRPLQYRKSVGTSAPQYILNISSKHMSNKLIELGVVKAKSLILTFPKWLNKELYHHFIRGYFDGDGCITSSSPNRNKEGRKSDVKWSIVGTEDFVINIQRIMIDKLNFNKTKIRKHKSAYYLEYKGGKQIETIKEWLYKDATIFLKRKYNKFINYASNLAISGQ